MSTPFQCDNKDALIAFVYDEIEPELKQQIAAHLRACAACAVEIDGLRAARLELAAWQPPEIGLNFAIAQKPATVLRPAGWWTPAGSRWAQAAAALLLFATGVGIANLQVRYGDEGLTISTGWLTPKSAAIAEAPAATPQRTDDWRPALTALETDLRRELQLVRSQTTAPARASTPASTVDADGLLRRVQALVAESEQRQRRELAVRLTQFNRDVELQRRADLTRINQDFRQLQGRTGFVEGYQREMANLLRRVSTQQVP